MQRYLLLISFILLSTLMVTVRAQEVDQKPLQDSIGSRAKFSTTIEMSKGYLSGISVLVRETDVFRGVLFNEFGITALEFTYNPQKKKVKLEQVIAMLDNGISDV